MSPITLRKQGESLKFSFSLPDGESINEWTCELLVQQYPKGEVFINQAVPAISSVEFAGLLTSTAMSELSIGLYRMVGLMTKVTTDEEVRDTDQRVQITQGDFIPPAAFRLLEDGGFRLLEDGSFRLLE